MAAARGRLPATIRRSASEAKRLRELEKENQRLKRLVAEQALDNQILRRGPRESVAEGKRLKLMPVVDEYTREWHVTEVERSITAEDVIATLRYLFRMHGEPEYIRSDNGPEFIAKAVREWLARSGVKTLYILPGSPWENAYVESFNGKLQDELLGREIFTRLLEAKVVIDSTELSTTATARSAFRGCRSRCATATSRLCSRWSAF